MNSGADSNYPTMALDDICNLPVAGICHKDAVLFLWVTVPMLQEGLEVMKSWGFAYKTMITWRKIMSLGMGYWFRGQTEHLLLGIKGKVKAFRCQRANFIQAKALRHSEKPEEFRQLIEAATVGLNPKIELFARWRVKGWAAYGNEIKNDVELQPQISQMTQIGG